SSRFRLSATERAAATGCHNELAACWADGMARLLKVRLSSSGGTSTPDLSRPDRAMNEKMPIRRLATGPAADMSACRRGYRCAQSGSYGVLAHPIIHPMKKKLITGTRTIPNG